MTGYIPTLEQIDELHRKIAPSKAAYELVHTHCVIVATIGCQIVRRQNALFTRRCTLPKDARRDLSVDWVHVRLGDISATPLTLNDPLSNEDARVDALIEHINQSAPDLPA